MNESSLVYSIRWLAYAALAVPLLFSVYFYPSHIAPQTFLFRIIVEMMVVAWAALVLKNSSFLPKSSFLAWAFSLFVGALFLSSFLGMDAYRSFFSDFERHWGVVTVLHFFLFFLVLSSAFKDAASWLKFIAVSVGVSAVAAAYGLWQFFFAEVGRAYSTVGNPSFLASYLLLNAVLALWLVFGSGLPSHQSNGGRIGRGGWVWGGVALLNSAVALSTGTRGAAVALVAGTLVLLAGYLLFGRKAHEARKWFLAAAAAGLVLVGALFVFRESEFAKQRGLERIFQVSLSEVTIKTRILSWRAGWEGFLEKPLTGAGPEHFNVVSNKHFRSDFYTYETAETEFDRAHNVFVEQLTTAGIIGLFSYLMLFGAMWWAGRAQVLLWVFLAVYAVQGMFGVDVFTSFLPLVVVAGYLLARRDGSEPLMDKGDSGKAVKSQNAASQAGFLDACAVLVVAAAMAYAAWVVNVKPALADMAFSDAHAEFQELGAREPQETIESAIGHYQKALGFDTYGRSTIRASLGRFALSAFGTFGRDAPGFRDELLPFAFAEAQKNVAEHPHNYLYHSLLANLYTVRYLLSETADPELEKSLEDARALAPERLELPLASAQLALAKGDVDAAIAEAEAGSAKNGRFPGFSRVAFLGYSIKGDAEGAFGAFDRGLAQNGIVPLNEREARWILSQYEQRGMSDKARALRERFPEFLQ